MNDLVPMAPCPYTKSGRHELGVITPENDDHDMTLFCSHCGALRRVAVTGALPGTPLDDYPAKVIADTAKR